MSIVPKSRRLFPIDHQQEVIFVDASGARGDIYNSVPRGWRAPMGLGRLGGSYSQACSEHRADTGHGCCAERLSPRQT